MTFFSLRQNCGIFPKEGQVSLSFATVLWSRGRGRCCRDEATVFKRREPSVPQRLLCPPTRASDMTVAKRGTSCLVLTGLNMRRVTQQNAAGRAAKQLGNPFFPGCSAWNASLSHQLLGSFLTVWNKLWAPVPMYHSPDHPLKRFAAPVTGENDHRRFTECSANSLCWAQTLGRGCGVRWRLEPFCVSSLFAELMRMFRFRFTFHISLFFSFLGNWSSSP